MPPNFDSDLLLITGASGKQAGALLPHIANTWKRLRLNVSTQASADRLKAKYPNAEVTTHDLADPHACQQLLSGVSFAFLVTPPVHPKETQCGINVISAAESQRKAGGPFKHLLLSSVIHPYISKLMNHDSKRRIEEYLVESTLPYTIVEPTHLMESWDLPGFIKGGGNVIPRFWNPETEFCFVSIRDLGEASAIILNDPEKHMYATYQLVGTRTPLSYTDAGKIISEELGRDVRLEQKSVEDGVKIFTSFVMKGEEAEFEMTQATGRLFWYYNEKGLVGNPNVLGWLLEREPLGYREWVRLCVEESKQVT